MPNVIQPKVTDNSKPAEAEKPKQAEAGKPESAKAGEQTEQIEVPDKYASLKKAGKYMLYAFLVVAILSLIKYLFFTAPMVMVAQVRQQDYTGELQGTGTVNVAVLASVGAKVTGRIEKMLVEEGDFVHSGQVIATLEDTDMSQVVQRSQARLESARLAEEAAQANAYQAVRAWEREKHLVAAGAVSQEEADQYQARSKIATSAVGTAHSEIIAMEADVKLQQFNLSQTKIFTYVSGIVIDRPKRSGDSIGSGDAVVKVADTKVILIEAYLDQRFARDVKAGQTATVFLRGRAKDQILGYVYRIRPQADPAAEEMTVEISFPLPPAELQIGQWADVYVATSQIKNALVVPKTAVMTMGDERTVLVADANNKVRQVKVESIASSPRSDVIAISGDLKTGEWVLTEPMGIKTGQKVRQDRTSKPKPAGLQMGTSPVMKM